MPTSGKDNGGVSAPFCAGLLERGVDSGVKVGGVPFRSRSMLPFGRSVRLA
jgi:hypothetical protein